MAKGYILKGKLTDKGNPTHDPNYQKAHRLANKAEKARYPEGYERMKKVDERLGKHELAGKNEPSGKIYVSAKVPKPLRAEVALHEKVENQNLRRFRHIQKTKK